MITQVRFSYSIQQFEEGFKQRWPGLSTYHDVNAPALFMGVYAESDVLAINNHKGFKLVWFTGADTPKAQYLKPGPNIKLVCNQFVYTRYIEPYLPWKHNQFVDIPIKSYDSFTPVPLGDNIYCYQSKPQSRKYGYEIADAIKAQYPNTILGYQGHSMAYVQSEYYAKAFVNIQLNPNAGFTSTLEMAHMGRASISNHPAMFCIPHGKTADIIQQLRNYQPRDINEVAQQARAFFTVTTPEWLDPKFWI
jgi:hypothetical protein